MHTHSKIVLVILKTTTAFVIISCYSKKFNNKKETLQAQIRKIISLFFCPVLINWKNPYKLPAADEIMVVNFKIEFPNIFNSPNLEEILSVTLRYSMGP